jgi:hypothetical protein
MTATPQPPWAPAPAPRWGAGRIVALVFGILLLLPGLALLFGGGVLLWADTVERNDDGYVFSERDAFATDQYALVSDRIDLETGADWVPLSAALGTARVEVTATGPTDEVFVGIAPVADGEAYLQDVGRTIIADLGFDNPTRTTTNGDAPSGPPADQDFWVAQSSGAGTQTVSWAPADGTWMLVVMNADGSADVSVDARLGATVPALDGLAWGLLGAGAFCTIVAVVLLVMAARRPARYTGPPSAFPAAYPPAAPPPGWTPPTPADRTTAADARPGSATTGPPPRRPDNG